MGPSLYCTWKYRSLLPSDLRNQFGDLDRFVLSLLASAKKRITIVAPYFTPSGVIRIASSLAISARQGAWVRLITSGLEGDGKRNIRAFRELREGKYRTDLEGRVRILICSDKMPAFIHAKVIIVDGMQGYLGSANISERALDSNFEVGKALSEQDAVSLDRLVDYWESQGHLKVFADGASEHG